MDTVCKYIVDVNLWPEFSKRSEQPMGCYFDNSNTDGACELYLHYMVIFKSLTTDPNICARVCEFLGHMQSRNPQVPSLRCLERVISMIRIAQNNPLAPAQNLHCNREILYSPDMILACTTYHNNMSTCHKHFFDMYKRKHHVKIVFASSSEKLTMYESSIGQLNFIIWLMKYGTPIVNFANANMQKIKL